MEIKKNSLLYFIVRNALGTAGCLTLFACGPARQDAAMGEANAPRQRISMNEGWRFYKYDSEAQVDGLIYDVRPEVQDGEDGKAADAEPAEAEEVEAARPVLKPWVLPTGNAFIKDPAHRHVRPEGDAGGDFPFVQTLKSRKCRLHNDYG